MLDYDFLMEYKRENHNNVTDALSKRFKDYTTPLVTLTMISIPTLELEELKQLYTNDMELQGLMGKLSREELGPKYNWRNGLLYYKRRLYIVNSKSFQLKLLKALHSTPTWAT